MRVHKKIRKSASAYTVTRTGATPVMSAVKTAEARVLASQDSKAYLGLVGNAEFNAAMVKLVLGDDGGAARK